MPATKNQIREWLNVAGGATHVIIMRDTFDNRCYPIYVHPDQDARQEASVRESGSMQHVQEVYHMGMDIEKQLAQERAMNYELPFYPTPDEVVDELLTIKVREGSYVLMPEEMVTASYALNHLWNYLHNELQRKGLGDIERSVTEKLRDNAKDLLDKMNGL